MKKKKKCKGKRCDSTKVKDHQRNNFDPKLRLRHFKVPLGYFGEEDDEGEGERMRMMIEMIIYQQE